MSGNCIVARGLTSTPAPVSSAKGHFIAFALAQFAAFTGLWAQKVAVGWLVWDLTHSPAWVGAVALSDMIAAIAVGPLSGAMADRTSAFRLIAATQTIILINTAVLRTLLIDLATMIGSQTSVTCPPSME